MILSLIDRWFEPIRVSRDYSREQITGLVLLIALGTALRFWNLAGAGLHGDEDIMGLAARGLLEQGAPVMPSGMLYVRALLHTYVIAGSLLIFGDNEWALRFPSALVGSLCGVLAFFFGRRFLGPRPNLAFVALVMFMPVMVEISKTGRMYVFLVASVLAFGTMIFQFETTARIRWLLAAFLCWLVGLLFHPLAAFAAPLFLFPGLSNRSWRQLLQGGAALLAAAVSYAVANDFVYRHYPDRADRLPAEPKTVLEPLDVFVDSGGIWIGLTALAVTAAWVFAVRRRSIIGSDQAVAIALLVLAVLAFAVLHYHVGSVLLVVGVVLWLRSGRRAIEIAFVSIPLLLLIAVQVAVLHHSGAYPGRRIIGALTGEPSVWPFIRFGAFSPAAVLSYMAILSVALVRLSNGQRVPVHFLLFIVSVWLPLFAMGVFTWDPEARYTLVALPGFLLCLVAGVIYVASTVRIPGTTPERTTLGRIALAFGMLVALQPGALLSAVRNDYSTHPDHRGAAEFVRSLPIQSGDVIIAEDSINQTYYLGRVDYRLLNVDVARKHSVVKNGVLRGQYTGTPVIGSGAALTAILDKARGRRVYIIGSGEDFADHRERSRGNGIREVLEDQRLEKIFVGRDGRTVVWTLRDRPRPSTAPTREVGTDLRQ